MHICVLIDEGPIKPIGVVILAVGVIVAVLRSPYFISHENHGQTQRKHGDREEVFYLPIPQRLNRRIIRWALHATVPAAVIVAAIAVFFVVGLVVLLVVGDQVV